MSDRLPRPPRTLPRRHSRQLPWYLQGSTFVDPRDIGLHPDTLENLIPEAYSDQGSPRSTFRLNQTSNFTVSDTFARAGLSPGSGPSMEAGRSTGARPSKAARSQPSAPNNTSMRPPPSLTTQYGHQSRSTVVLRPHNVPAPGSAQRASPPARAGAANRVIVTPEATQTKGRPPNLSDPWEVMLVNSILELEQAVEETIKELIRLEKGQPALNPGYRGTNWADTHEAVSQMLAGAIHKIESYEHELRHLGVVTRLPGPGRFRLDRIPRAPGGQSYEVGDPGAGGLGTLGGGPRGPQRSDSRPGTTWEQGQDPIQELRSLLASSKR
jgi:hypothetical protein